MLPLWLPEATYNTLHAAATVIAELVIACLYVPVIATCIVSLALEYISIITFFVEFFFVVSLTFNGTTITGPILIYHDEIVSDSTIPTDDNSDGPGDLVCRSASIGRTFWRTPTGANAPSSTSEDFYQVRTPLSDPQTHPYLAQLSIDYLDSTDSEINGLWFCPLGFTGNNTKEQDLIDSFIYVGIYSRNSGELL